MKQFYFLLFISLIGLASWSFYYSNIQKKSTYSVATTSSLPNEGFYLYREYGEVLFKKLPSDTYTLLTNPKVILTNHVSVKTGDGRGYIIFPDNSSIAISSSTEVEITYTPTKITVQQYSGSTYHRVIQLATKNKYEVRTPNSLSTVMGTKFGIIYNKNAKKTFVIVTEHNVEVTKTKEDSVIMGAPVIAQEGSFVELQSATTTILTGTSSNEKVTVRNINEDKEVAFFVEENKTIDKEYDAITSTLQRIFLEKMISALQKDAEQKNKDADIAYSEELNPLPKIENRTITLKRVLKEISQGSSSPIIIKKKPETYQETSSSTNVSTTKKYPQEVEPQPQSGGGTLRNISTLAEELTPEDELFIDSFYNVYEKYYLVEDPTLYCKNIGTISGEGIMSNLLLVTNKANVILPNQPELTLFAQDLVAACKNGTMTAKVADFKAKFDVLYPY